MLFLIRSFIGVREIPWNLNSLAISWINLIGKKLIIFIICLSRVTLTLSWLIFKINKDNKMLQITKINKNNKMTRWTLNSNKKLKLCQKIIQNWIDYATSCMLYKYNAKSSLQVHIGWSKNMNFGSTLHSKVSNIPQHPRSPFQISIISVTL